MLKCVCVGAGYFAKFHLDAWNRIPEVSLLAICDLDITKAQRMANTYQIPFVFTDVEKMIQEVKPDFIDIITPPFSHLSLCQLAAKEKIAVICQKPLAPTLVEAKAIIQLTMEASIPFMVHENFRFQPWYRKIKSLILSQSIGERIHYLSFRMRTGDGWPDDAYLNRRPYFRTMPLLLIHETGIHFIDTFRYLCGEIDKVDAKLRRLNSNIKGEDFALIVFEFQNGAIGILDANRFNEPKHQNARYTFGELQLEGNKGTIRLYQDGRITLQKLGKTEENVPYHHADLNFAGDCVYYTQLHFVQSLLNGSPFETNGIDYLKNLEWQAEIYRQNGLVF